VRCLHLWTLNGEVEHDGVFGEGGGRENRKLKKYEMSSETLRK